MVIIFQSMITLFFLEQLQHSTKMELVHIIHLFGQIGKLLIFGTMQLKKGDNIIYVELTNAIAFTGNITKSSGTINIDKFDVKYLD